jgi:hypothetical protein
MSDFRMVNINNSFEMRFPKWIWLSLTPLIRLVSASDVRIGLSLSAAPPATLSQPQPEDISLDLNFFVQVANQELKVPIMPLYIS